jgi:hypothetical protein
MRTPFGGIIADSPYAAWNPVRDQATRTTNGVHLPSSVGSASQDNGVSPALIPRFAR